MVPSDRGNAVRNSRSDPRSALLDALAERAGPARRLGIDGPDAAGKSTLAAELAAALAGHGAEVTVVGLDAFLRPAEERYRLGPESPEGYFLDSSDLPAFRRAVLAAPGVVVAEGVFLLRAELAGLWDFTVFLDVREDEIVRRAEMRDSHLADVAARYRRRYLPAQRAYRDATRPHERADVVIDNNDPARPVLLRG
jgi:uridine kinase